MEAFAKLFPFWSTKQVRRIIKKLEANGAIYIGNYNQRGFDRTQWYALAQTVTSIYLNGQMEVTKWANGSDQMGTPIPDSKPVNKPVINNIGIFEEYAKQNEELLTALLDFESMRKTIKKPLTDRAKQMLITELEKIAKNDNEKITVLNKSTLNNWKSVYPVSDVKPNKPDKPKKRTSYNLDENFKNAWSVLHNGDDDE